MRIRKILLSAILAAACAMPAFADDGEVDDEFVSFGPRAAYFDPKEDGADETWFGGAQLRFHFGILAIEGSVDYRETDAGELDIQTYPVQASLLVYLIENKPVSLYLLGGGGWYFTRIDGPAGFDDQTDEDFGPHAGGGLQFFIDDDWSIDGSYRYIWLDELEASDDPNVVDREYDASGSMVTAAINYHF